MRRYREALHAKGAKDDIANEELQRSTTGLWRCLKV